MLNREQIKEFKRLCKQIDYKITYIAVKSVKKGVILGAAKEDNTDVRTMSDEVIKKLYLLALGKTIADEQDKRFFEETKDDKIYVPSAEIDYQYAIEMLKQQERNNQRRN